MANVEKIVSDLQKLCAKRSALDKQIEAAEKKLAVEAKASAKPAGKKPAGKKASAKKPAAPKPAVKK